MVEASIESSYDDNGVFRGITAHAAADDDVTTEQIYAAVTAAYSAFANANNYLDMTAEKAPDHVPDNLTTD